MDNTKQYKFSGGPYKGLVWKIMNEDEKTGIVTIKIAQYNKVVTVDRPQMTEWEWRMLN